MTPPATIVVPALGVSEPECKVKLAGRLIGTDRFVCAPDVGFETVTWSVTSVPASRGLAGRRGHGVAVVGGDGDVERSGGGGDAAGLGPPEGAEHRSCAQDETGRSEDRRNPRAETVAESRPRRSQGCHLGSHCTAALHARHGVLPAGLHGSRPPVILGSLCWRLRTMSLVIKSGSQLSKTCETGASRPYSANWIRSGRAVSGPGIATLGPLTRLDA